MMDNEYSIVLAALYSYFNLFIFLFRDYSENYHGRGTSLKDESSLVKLKEEGLDSYNNNQHKKLCDAESICALQVGRFFSNNQIMFPLSSCLLVCYAPDILNNRLGFIFCII